MPQYIEVNGEVVEFPDNMSDAQIAAALKGQSSKTTQEAPITSGFLMGLKDPISGGAQLLPRGLEAITSLGGAAPNIVSRFFGSEAERVNKMVQQEEAAYQAARKAQGETGFDVSRLAGNVLNPANLAAVSRGPALVRAATTGAVAGSLQPVYEKNDQYWSSKALQAGLGAALGPLTELGVNATSKIAGAVKSLTPAGREQAMKKYVESLAGDDKQAVIKALQDAKELVTGSRPTVAEALADIPSAAELIAAQSKLANKPGLVGKFADRSAEQQAARVRAIQSIAGTEAQKAALEAERSAVTGEMRETALAQADTVKEAFAGIEGTVLNQARKLARTSEEITAGTGTAPSEFMLLARNRVADLKQQQLKSLESNGVFALESKGVIDSLNKAITGATSDTTKTVLTSLRDKIVSKTDADGLISSRDLYENVRKTSNQDIAKLLGLGEQYASGGIPEQAAKALGNAKKYIDASLDKSSNGLWSKYINSYTDYSNKLNRMEIGDYLVKRLQTPLDKERAGVFATAVENAAGTIKKSTGIPRYEKLEQVLSKQEVGTVNAVLADLTRKTKAEQLAAKVGALEGGLPDVAGAVPGLLSKTVTLTREALTYLQQGNQRKFNEKLSELLLDPAATATLMTSGIPKGRISDLTSSMMKFMDEPTKAAFIQSFTVPTATRGAGE